MMDSQRTLHGKDTMQNKSYSPVAMFMAVLAALLLGNATGSLADSAADCAGFNISKCFYIPPNDQYPNMWHLDISHSSGRAVFRVRDRTWTPARGLGFSFQNRQGMGAGDCSGFRISKCQYMPPNDQYPSMWLLSFAHSSGRPVFRVKDRSWSPAQSLGFCMQK